jgi:hypothetical protein
VKTFFFVNFYLSEKKNAMSTKKCNAWKAWENHLKELGYDLSRQKVGRSGHIEFFCADPSCNMYFTDGTNKDAEKKGILPYLYTEARAQIERCIQRKRKIEIQLSEQKCRTYEENKRTSNRGNTNRAKRERSETFKRQVR